MALSFPNNPSVGDIYEDSASGFSYQWSGEVWKSYKVSTDSLGGNLDADLTLNSNDITGTGDIDITGNLKVSGIATASAFVGDITGDVTGNTSGTAGGLTGSPNITVTDISASGDVTITSTDTGSSAGPELTLYRNSASPAPGDYLGQLMFKGENSNGGEENYAKITGKISDETLGTEDGLIETAIKGDGSFVIVSRQRSDELQLINGVGLSVDGTISGNLTGDVTGNITGVAATFSGDVSIGGTLTYQDVTNVDSVGLITARTGVRVTTGGIEVSAGGLNITGVTTSTSFVKSGGTSSQFLKADGSVDSSTYITSADGGNAATLDSLDSTSFLRSDAADTKTSGNLTFNDNIKANFGTSGDLEIYHNGSHSIINDVGTGNLSIQCNAGEIQLAKGGTFEHMVRAIPDGSVELYYDNSKKFETTSGGVYVSGQVRSSNAHIIEGDANQLVLFPGGTSQSVIHRNDATNYYILLSGSGTSASASWNSDRPFRIENSTGNVYLANGQFVAYHDTAFVSANGVNGNWVATQAEAEAGTNNDQIMTPLRVAQAIAAQGGSVIASIQRGTAQAAIYPSSNSRNVTISSVNTSKTMVNHLGCKLSGATANNNTDASVKLTSSTNIQLECANISYIPVVSWEVIEFT